MSFGYQLYTLVHTVWSILNGIQLFKFWNDPSTSFDINDIEMSSPYDFNDHWIDTCQWQGL